MTEQPGGAPPKDRRKVTIVVSPDWGPEPRRFVVRWKIARMLLTALALAAVAAVAMVASFSSMARRAMISDQVARERDELLAGRDSMAVLAERLAALDVFADQLRTLSGLEVDRDSALWLPVAPAARPGDALPAPPGDSARTPTLWPLTEAGFLTQSLLEGGEGGHPGIDIAIASGSYVRASGGGTVLESGIDPIYGEFILLDHGDRVWSRYGHLQYRSVQRGQQVSRGEVIGLSGSTGRSTAPHLHFEILFNGRPVDPLTMVSPP